ncbi:uncharacterized protein C2orf78-like [Cavia porcellus]|uniref:uncharacterized protein C2orf78-like n=1 Tax=Cavia porcellus TaxID=10141 RepID=UPI00035118AB|nr:uncharacterized protein C2orf78-like [Cavia porcellus]
MVHASSKTRECGLPTQSVCCEQKEAGNQSAAKHFHIPPSTGTSSAQQLSPCIMSNAASLPPSACSSSGVTPPGLSSARLLPSTSATYFEPVMASTHIYQHCSTSRFAGVSGQSQLSTLALPYPGLWQWDQRVSSAYRYPPLHNTAMTVTEQSTVMASTPMPACAAAMIPVYPSASLVPATLPAHMASQGHGHYYSQGAMGPLLSAEDGAPYPYEWVPHTGSGASGPQQHIVMVLKEIQHTKITSTSASPTMYNSESTQANTKMRYPVKETCAEQDRPLGSEDQVQEVDASQLREFIQSCTSSCTQLLEVPEPPGLLASTECPIPEQLGYSDGLGGKHHLSPQQARTLDKGMEGSPGWADVGALVEDIQLPQVLHPLEDLEDSKQPTAMEAHDDGAMDVSGVQESSGTEKCPSPQGRESKHKASEPMAVAPEAKIQVKAKESQLGGPEGLCSVVASDRAPEGNTQKTHRKSPRAASGRPNQDKGCRQARAKKTNRKAAKRRQPTPQIKAEDKPIANRKRKRQPPVLGQESFKMPRTCLGMHMLESVQVFHPLGKKLDKRAGPISSQALGISNVTKDAKTSHATKPWPRAPHVGKGTERARDNSQNLQKPGRTEDSNASLCERPPPGQVKLISLQFPSPVKPQEKPVSRRPQAFASRRPTVAHHAGPAATSTAHPSQRACTNPSMICTVKPAQTMPNGTCPPLLTTSTQPGLPQSAKCKPPCQVTPLIASLRREPVACAVTKRRSPPQRPNPFLLEDFSRQPIPWREPNVPEPVMSSPITAEQRPEREAMKRQAQRERELAAQYTSLGKLQFFKQREIDREIAQYYGYAR